MNHDPYAHEPYVKTQYRGEQDHRVHKGERTVNAFAKMIERMEDLILAGMGIPLTPWTVVHGDKLVPLLDRIRESLPDEIREAQLIVARQEDIVADAQRKAVQIVEDAKRQAENLLSESELMHAVHTEAERIRQQVMGELETMRKKTFEDTEELKSRSYEEARNVKEGADRYAETVLSSLEKSTTEFLGVIRNGQKHLKRSRAEVIQQLAQSSGRSGVVSHSASVIQAGLSPSSSGSSGNPQQSPQLASIQHD
ncbi:MAG: ATP synthase F0 subunit B [Cyanobacteria bacterium]|nr:ATP synthase F0 subunit B [Cyanobacteriota bacterium]